MSDVTTAFTNLLNLSSLLSYGLAISHLSLLKRCSEGLIDYKDFNSTSEYVVS